MVNTKYSVAFDPEHEARAYRREMKISRKYAREFAVVLKNKQLTRAKRYLIDVIDQKVALPVKKYNKKVPHRKQISGWDAGRFPQKTAKHLLSLLEEVENNAVEKGLDENKLYVKHMITYGGRQKRWNRGSRVFGRRTQKRARAANVEVVIAER